MAPAKIEWLKFKEPFFQHRRFKHRDLLNILESKKWNKSVVGKSYEGREIYELTWGQGDCHIMMWSQMHGNEATATMALIDFFNYLETAPQHLKHYFTIHAIPMLNPDGAERFQRRTAQEIDMNRDAVALATPESKILESLQRLYKPRFSFNLHDQDIRYAAGPTANQAAISFLATAYNEDREWNENRTRAAQLIAGLNNHLQQHIPNKVGRFSDEFEARAFGDNIQKWGSSLVLIESGGYKDDPEKMYLRKLNFELYVKALTHIYNQVYLQYTISDYESIPENTKCLYDLVLRNVSYRGATVDIGINLHEVNNKDASNFTTTSTIEDIGDLQNRYGLKEIKEENLKVEPLSSFPEKLNQDLNLYKHLPLLEEKAYFALINKRGIRYLILDGQVHQV